MLYFIFQVCTARLIIPNHDGDYTLTSDCSNFAECRGVSSECVFERLSNIFNSYSCCCNTVGCVLSDVKVYLDGDVTTTPAAVGVDCSNTTQLKQLTDCKLYVGSP